MLHDLHNIAGHETHELILEGFRRESDPYGVPWRPTRRSNPILQDTLALRDGITWRADSRGVELHTSGRANDYAAFHQRGTRKMARRKFMPDPGQLPPIYERQIGNAFRDYFRERCG